MKVISGLLIFCLSCPVLAREDDAAKHPDWSPDGSQLTFEAIVGGVSNVYIAELRTAKATQLSHTETMDSYPRFTPGGDSLVFVSRRYGRFSTHFVSTKTNVVSEFPTDGESLEAAVSPDGRHITFRSFLPESAEIIMTRIDGSGMRRLTNNEVEDGFPSFSSNGKSLFFHRVIGKHKQLFMLDLVSETETQLTFGDYSSAHAHQSPDGDNIVFDAEEGGDRNIFKMSLKTRTISQLTDAPGRDGYPKWSPDGKTIAFHSQRDGVMAIFLMQTDGADQRKFQVIHDHEEL